MPQKTVAVESKLGEKFVIKSDIRGHEVVIDQPTNAAGTDTGGNDEVGLGEAMIGGANDLMEKVMKKTGLIHSIQNNVLIVRPRGGSDGQPPITVSAATGLIDSVQVSEKSVTGKCLLIPQIEPGRLINLISLVTQGEYVITRATYRGDTHGSDWYVEWEAMLPGSKISLPAAA